MELMKITFNVLVRHSGMRMDFIAVFQKVYCILSKVACSRKQIEIRCKYLENFQ